jgi:hypothetical protein
MSVALDPKTKADHEKMGWFSKTAHISSDEKRRRPPKRPRVMSSAVKGRAA